MGISSRDYYREFASSDGSWSAGGLTPVVKYLIIANAVVFLLQIFVTSEMPFPLNDKMAELIKDQPALFENLPHVRISIVQKWLELDPNKVVYEGQVWRLLTHAFCHDRNWIYHIVFNMVVLFWFGCTLEFMYGSREFLLFYLTSAVFAGLAYVALDLYTGKSVPAIGASGAVMAVAMLYTMHFPYETIYLFWFIPLQMRFVMMLYVLWDLHPVLLTLSGDVVYSGIAHAAHLGGAAFGFLYARYQWRLEPLSEWIRWPSANWRRSRPRLRIAEGTFPEPRREIAADADLDRVDELLQKIFETGQASLTEEERSVLLKASERMKNRVGRNL